MALNNQISSLLLLFLLFSLSATLPKACAKIATFDEDLQKRAAESYQESLQEYNPNPQDLTDEFNELVGK